MPPSFIRGGDIYGGLEPTVWIGWPKGNVVFARVRGAGLSIWNNLGPARGMRCFPMGGLCAGDVQLVAVVNSVGATTACPYNGLAVPGNVQSFSPGILYDMEAIAFSVENAVVVDNAQMTWSGLAVGPLTLDGVTFPLNDSTATVRSNLVDAAGGQLVMMKWAGDDGIPLYVTVVSGARALPGPPTATGWTLAMSGTLMSVFVYDGMPAGGGVFIPGSDVVTDICLRAGLDVSQINVALLQATGNIKPSDVVQGYVIERPTPAADVLKVLMQAFFFEACESDGQMVFVPRGLAPKLTIPEADLGLENDNCEITEQVEQEQDLPQKYSVLYNDPILQYQQGKQEKGRNTRIVKTKQETVVSIPMVMDPDWARSVAEKALYLAWLERQSFEFNVPRASYLLLDPTDVIEFVYQGLTFTMRVVENSLGQGFVVELKGVNENSANYLSQASGAGSTVPGGGRGNQVVPPTALFLFDVPLLQDTDANPSGTGKYAALGSVQPTVWPGAALFISSDDASFTQEGSPQRTDAVFGEAVGVLANPVSPFTQDNVNTLTVKLSSGAFAGDTLANVLNGSNMLIYGSEIVQFTTAVQNMDGSWTLSGLLRGRRGTEWACGFWGDFYNGTNMHADGELVVAASAPGSAIGSLGLFRVQEPLNILNALRYYRGVTLGQDLTTAPDVDFTITGKDLMPYAPVKVGGLLDGSGNLVITWLRRSRIGGDGWGEGSDVPLSEDSELYDVEILAGDDVTVLRTISGLTTPTCIYTAAQQIADFGSAPATVNVNVYQISGEVGRGFKGHGVAPSSSPAPEVLPASGGFYVNGS